MKRFLLAVALFLTVLPAAQAGVLYVQVGYVFDYQNHLTYSAEASYDYDFLDIQTANVYGIAHLNGTDEASQYFGPPYTNHPDYASGHWEYDGTYGTCYEVHATATEDINGTIQSAGSGTFCADWQPPSYNLLISTNVDGVLHTVRYDRYQAGTNLEYSPITPTGYVFNGWSGFINSSQETITFQMPNNDIELTANFSYLGSGGDPGDDDGGIGNEDLPCFPGIDVNCYSSPIIINFESGGYRLTGRNAPVLFDMAGNGHPSMVGWTAAGADEAFLWLDRNHNGRVTSGAELFGNFTRLQNGQLARNGFEALREYDVNSDGVIDDRDPIWPRLMLWRDLNHNGVSEPNELAPLEGSGVTSIDLHYHWSGRHDSWRNEFKYESLVSITNDKGHGVHKQPVYDIFFAPLPYVP
jgi:uncharacterized repeat protein (TIGR02543 family)